MSGPPLVVRPDKATARSSGIIVRVVISRRVMTLPARSRAQLMFDLRGDTNEGTDSVKYHSHARTSLRSRRPATLCHPTSQHRSHRDYSRSTLVRSTVRHPAHNAMLVAFAACGDKEGWR
jgi:hypothetical protein